MSNILDSLGATKTEYVKSVGLTKVGVTEFKIYPNKDGGSNRMEFVFDNKQNYSIFLGKEIEIEKDGVKKYRFRDRFGRTSYFVDEAKNIKSEPAYFEKESATKLKEGEENLINFLRALFKANKETESPLFDFSKLNEGKLILNIKGTEVDFKDAFDKYSKNGLVVCLGVKGKYTNVFDTFSPEYALNTDKLASTQKWFKKCIDEYNADAYRDKTGKAFYTSDLLRPFNAELDLVNGQGQSTVTVVTPKVEEAPVNVNDLPF
jgi:hypothetical protein